eukprot:6202405-Prymnesium_polylepis.1
MRELNRIEPQCGRGGVDDSLTARVHHNVARLVKGKATPVVLLAKLRQARTNSVRRKLTQMKPELARAVMPAVLHCGPCLCCCDRCKIV